MATAAIPTPEVVTGPAPTPATKSNPVNLTDSAITKVKEIMATQDPLPAGLRIGVVGGGCSGFQYSMSFENAPGMMDKIVRLDAGKLPPIVSWGVMLNEAQNMNVVALYPWLMLPVLPVILVILAFNFLGDGLRDAADPYH